MKISTFVKYSVEVAAIFTLGYCSGQQQGNVALTQAEARNAIQKQELDSLRKQNDPYEYGKLKKEHVDTKDSLEKEVNSYQKKLNIANIKIYNLMHPNDSTKTQIFRHPRNQNTNKDSLNDYLDENYDPYAEIDWLNADVKDLQDSIRFMWKKLHQKPKEVIKYDTLKVNVPAVPETTIINNYQNLELNLEKNAKGYKQR